MLSGYAGRILFVDLEKKQGEEEELSTTEALNFLGGYGINNLLALKLVPPQVDPFSPENLLVLGAGPFTGTLIPGAAKLVATLKFPLNGAFGTAAAGSRFPLMLKSCGYDHLLIKGSASSPLTLIITDEGIKFEEAGELWGQDVFQTTDFFLQKYEPCSVLPIGPAGEKKVKISITLVDKGGTLGSGGLPAVLGAKNLKAIVVRQGRKPIRVAQGPAFLKLVNELHERILRWPGRKAILRGGVGPSPQEWWGLPPLKNPWELTADPLSKEEKEKVFELFALCRRTIACPSCLLADKERITVGELRAYLCHLKREVRGKAKDPMEELYQRVRYHQAADGLGICLHTFLGLFSALLQLYEEGKVSKKDLGMELKDAPEIALKLLVLTAKREGIGEVLAEGFPGLRKEFGGRAGEIALQVKGRYALWDPRLNTLGTMEFGELTNPRGVHFQAGGSPSYAPGKTPEDFVRHAARMGVPEEAVKKIEKEGFNPGRYTKYSEDWFSLFSSLGICNRAFVNRFYYIGLITELFRTLTGADLSSAELMRGAERGWNLARMLNLRAGFSKKDDEPPTAWFESLKGEGEEFRMQDYFRTKFLTKGDVESYLQDYYRERGWDEQGRPTPEKLSALGLNEFTSG